MMMTKSTMWVKWIATRTRMSAHSLRVMRDDSGGFAGCSPPGSDIAGSPCERTYTGEDTTPTASVYTPVGRMGVLLGCGGVFSPLTRRLRCASCGDLSPAGRGG